MKKIILIAILLAFSLPCRSQLFDFEKTAWPDSSGVQTSIKKLAQNVLKVEIAEPDRFQVELLAGEYAASLKSLQAVSSNMENEAALLPYELFAEAQQLKASEGLSFENAYQNVLRNYLSKCSDTEAAKITIRLTTYDAVAQFTAEFEDLYKEAPTGQIGIDEAVRLLKSAFRFQVFSLTEPLVYREAELDEQRRYLITEDLIISPLDGAELSVVTVRKRISGALPAILIFTIYAENNNKNQAMIAAAKGYVGVIATSRGKGQSTNAIEPYLHEHKDVNVVIDWISRQPWCNGQVGMYGGSYNGFAQWAALKNGVHPALKTIVPSVSAAPGIDVPMENNIFFNFPYKWIPYVTNNRYLDVQANLDRSHWEDLENKLYQSGAPFARMDSLDGKPNQLFHEWTSDPTYDAYWQSMIPYKEDFAHITIPVLTTTGYYDDGQPGALYYYREHLKYRPEAEHYLVIGPYDHWGAQSASVPNLRGYEIDEVATLNIREELAFEWFDYILKGGSKPQLLKDKVNVQIMGRNQWLHAPNLHAIANDSLTFSTTTRKAKFGYLLAEDDDPKTDFIPLAIDFADRSDQANANYYPWPIIRESIDLTDGLIFQTEPFEEDMIMSGSFSGDFHLISNKKDFDYAVTLYELTPEGNYFHLSYHIGRASFAQNRESRKLLKPGEVTHLTFGNTRIISKKIARGSRLVVVINGNKNPYTQINYGTGQDVSLESIRDAGKPLHFELRNDSRISIPIFKEDENKIN
ncbi:CocE/NonD family hydrolase [Jiulongibacter sediminis]|uniref:CocE/NonD family hydrolase n=1 Tax=Jiulongibacter sediminis TaxID=1605367 RepID=UPI0026EB729B|nr:CocE/NonD family hydrolase [Jiulongibacter sediminis]